VTTETRTTDDWLRLWVEELRHGGWEQKTDPTEGYFLSDRRRTAWEVFVMVMHREGAKDPTDRADLDAAMELGIDAGMPELVDTLGEQGMSFADIADVVERVAEWG
jgi:hypothetical protein